MSRALRFQNMATRLLTKYDERRPGVDAIQLEQTPINFNPVTGEDELGTPVLTNLVGISIGFGEDFTDASGDKNTVQTGDQLLQITHAVEPLMGDKILMDGLKYSIISISPSRYTNRTSLYTVHIGQ